MTWLFWLTLAVLVTAVAAVPASNPKARRHVAHTSLMASREACSHRRPHSSPISHFAHIQASAVDYAAVPNPPDMYRLIARDGPIDLSWC